MTRKAVPRITAAEVETIRNRFRPDMSTEFVSGIDIYQEEAGDVVSLLGPNGLPLIGFAKGVDGFYLVDERGDVLLSAPVLDSVLDLAQQRILLRGIATRRTG
jgi:hypothetical protein